jgi:hypothetical protein
MHNHLTLLYCISFLYTSMTQECVDIDLQIISRKSKEINNKAASIRLTGRFPSTLDTKHLKLTFLPSMMIDVDYTIEPLTVYRLPPPYQKSKSNMNSMRLLLVNAPDKHWVKNTGNTSNFMSLFLLNVKYCAKPTGIKLGEMSMVELANISLSVLPKCPMLSNLPRVDATFQSFIDGILTPCQQPKIIASAQLETKHLSSLSLLYLHPPVLFVDGRGSRNIQDAASLVDKFLASHGVMEVAWEPMEDSDPRWWVLLPRPPGMPGHLFAMIDMLQWRHPFVTSAASRFNGNYNCTKDKVCVPGCPGSLIVGAWCSGWGADSQHMSSHFARAVLDFGTPLLRHMYCVIFICMRWMYQSQYRLDPFSCHFENPSLYGTTM